ncbi:MAG: O-antigen polysaccharide polymerase Wzy [Candidatus Saccharibacteria bacterium]
MKSKWIIFFITYIFIFFSIFTLSFINYDIYNINKVCIYWGLIIVSQLILFFILYYSKHKTLNNPFIYFVITAFVCWFGQIMVVLFNLNHDTTLIINTFNSSELYATLQYSTICFFTLCIAGLLFSGKNSYSNFTTGISDKIFKKSMNLVGMSLSFIGIYGYFSEKFTSIASSFNTGYSSMYQNNANALDAISNSTDNVISNFSMFFIPGIVILFIANKDNKTIRRIIVSVLLSSVLMSFIAGGRAEALAIIIGLFWIYSSEIKKIDLKVIIWLIIIAIFILKLITAIAQFRIMPDRSLSVFIDIFFSNSNSFGNSLGNMMGEFGFNIFSLHETMNLIPATQDYSLGYTYFASVMAVIPSFLFGGYSFSSAAGLPSWLMNKLHMDYGPGYSIVAESYYNFGWIGIISMFIIGIILVKMLSNDKTNDDYKSLRNGLIAIIIYSNLFIARGTFLLIFRKYFYTVLIPTMLIMFAYEMYRRRGRNLNA